MKIKNLKAKGFGKFIDLEIEFDGQITKLVGANGSGKTSILYMIWAALKGIAEKDRDGQLIGERFRFISNGKSADLELTLFDEDKQAEIKVSNHITAAGNHISFKAPDDYPISDEWLKNLLSVAFLSAKNFTALAPQEQALLLGIDTSEYDEAIAEIKQEYTLLNRDYRNYGELEPVEPVEAVSVSALLEEKEGFDNFNLDQRQHAQAIKNINSEIVAIQGNIYSLEEKLSEHKNLLDETRKAFADMGLPKEEKDTSAIKQQIQDAESINERATKFGLWKDRNAEKELKKKELDKNKFAQANSLKERLEYIKLFDFGFSGLTVGEDGSLLLDGRPIAEPYFSKGELELIVAKLYASQNPEFKVRFIDDFELLDEDNQEKILKELLEAGFQVITAEVGKESKGFVNTVLLRECRVVESYKEDKQKKLL